MTSNDLKNLFPKTKVAPMKNIRSPKLELCAAVLLAKLMKNVKNAFKINIDESHFYSDSQITLAWIRKDSHVWKTFLANRVSKIHELSNRDYWHYINTKANPADYASRGMLPSELKDNELWWHGSSVLMNEESCAPEKIKNLKFETDLEQKKIKTTALHMAADATQGDVDICIEKFSSFEKAIKTIAFCKRYIEILREKKSVHNILKSEKLTEKCKQQILTVDELGNAKNSIIRMCQMKYFTRDLGKLEENQCL